MDWLQARQQLLLTAESQSSDTSLPEAALTEPAVVDAVEQIGCEQNASGQTPVPQVCSLLLASCFVSSSLLSLTSVGVSLRVSANTYLCTNCHFVNFSALTLLVGRQEWHPACKKTLSGGGAGMVVCLERDADLHTAQLMPLPLIVSCFSKIQIGFTFLLPADPGSPRQRAVKWVCVCVCNCQFCFDSFFYVFIHPVNGS